MMKTSNRSVLLFYYFLMILTIVRTASVASNRRIIKHDKGINPLRNLDSTKSIDADQQLLLSGDDFDFTLAFLEEADLSYVNGTVYNDELIELPTYDSEAVLDDPEVVLDDPTDVANYTSNLRGSAAKTLNDFIMPTTVPKCNAEANSNIRVFVIDTVFGPSKYLNHNVVQYKSYVGKNTCDPHGGYCAKIIDTMAPNGDMNFFSIGVFTCEGRGYSSSIISAIGDVVAHKKNAENKNPQKASALRYIVNYSGGGGFYRPTNDAFKAAEKAGISVYTSAGNGNADCIRQSPATAAADEITDEHGIKTSISSIGASCDQRPCSFTNYEVSSNKKAQCVTLNLQGCLTVTNLMTGSPRRICGTSFSGPYAMGRHLVLQSTSPELYGSQVKQELAKHVIRADVPKNSHFSGKWDVIDELYACPSKPVDLKLFEGTLSLGKSTSGQFLEFYGATGKDGAFCITFQANTNRGAMIIGARGIESPDTVLKSTIGKRRKNKKARLKYEHILSYSDNELDKTRTKKRILTKKKNYRSFRVESDNGTFLVQYQSKKGMVNLLESKVDDTYTEVGFSSNGGGVKIKNAKRCSA